ncbi:MAG: ribonuclease H-like domain-containing protein [Candidatus Heimdallarchaeota archaeon]|nr:ribonuclease H-like domain-containing protein [Candidatus Heimdallarchaeota archaeon]MDH5644819.1 ribonuclease H-like domain-containing protein [Candidatus Heimdallarchaeota archaeon]
MDEKSLRFNKGKWIRKITIPNLDRLIFIDIETDLACERVWMIGLLQGNELVQLLAENWKEEEKILDDFANYLEGLPFNPLVFYSGTNFDIRVIWNRAIALNKTKLITTLRGRMWIDLLLLLQKGYVPICGSYSLKNIATEFNYELSQDDYNGLRLALEYLSIIRHNQKLPEDFKKIAYEYNADDVFLIRDIIANNQDKFEFYPIQKPGKDPSLDKIRSMILSKNNAKSYYRINVAHENENAMKFEVMKYGVTLPQVIVNKKSTTLRWTGKLAKSRIQTEFWDRL